MDAVAKPKHDEAGSHPQMWKRKSLKQLWWGARHITKSSATPGPKEDFMAANV